VVVAAAAVTLVEGESGGGGGEVNIVQILYGREGKGVIVYRYIIRTWGGGQQPPFLELFDGKLKAEDPFEHLHFRHRHDRIKPILSGGYTK
jgi:hypothetical protein